MNLSEKINNDLKEALKSKDKLKLETIRSIRALILEHEKSGKSKVKIVIYDVLGKQVTELVNESLAPGSYEVNWDASNYPSGVYFYRLTTNDYITTRKMILIK